MSESLGQLGVLNGGLGSEDHLIIAVIISSYLGRGAQPPDNRSVVVGGDRGQEPAVVVPQGNVQPDDFINQMDEFLFRVDVESHPFPEDVFNPRFGFLVGELFDENWNSIFTPTQFFDQGGNPFCGVSAIFYAWYGEHPDYEVCVHLRDDVFAGSDIGSTFALARVLAWVSDQSALLAIYHKVHGEWILTPVGLGGRQYVMDDPVVIIRYTSNSDLGDDAVDSVHGHWDCVYTSLPKPLFFTEDTEDGYVYTGGGVYIATGVNLTNQQVSYVPLDIGFSANGQTLPQTPAGFFAFSGAGRKKKKAKKQDHPDTPESELAAQINRALSQLEDFHGNSGFRNKNVDHQKKVNGGRNDPDDMRERPVGRMHPAAKRQADREAKQLDRESKYVLIVFSSLIPHGWDGEELYYAVETSEDNPLPEAFSKWDVDQDRYAVGFNTGVVRPCREESADVKQVVFSKPGYCKVDLEDGDKIVKARGCYAELDFDEAFVYDGKLYETCSFVYFIPFMEFLKSKVSTAVCTETHRNMALAAVNRHYPNFNHDSVVADTISAFMYYNAFRLFRQQTGYGKFVVEHRDRLVDSEMVKFGELEIQGDVAYYPSIDCPVADNYPFRDDCALVFTSNRNGHNAVDGVYTAALEELQGANWTYPKFVTSVPDANGGRYYRSTFLGFWPANAAPFLTYSVNALNACKALKRMCGARENRDFDKVLTRLQYSAFGHVFYSEKTGWRPDVNRDVFDPSPTWRQRFLDIARLRIIHRDGSPKLFEGFVAGNKKICEHVNESVARYYWGSPEQRKYKPSYYSNPVHLTRESFWSGAKRVIDCDGDANLLWFDEHCKLQLIFDQMEVGFGELLSDFNKTTLQSYADSHPNWIYKRNFENFKTFLSYQECREDLSMIDHIKKALRIMFVQREIVHTPDNNMTRFVEARVKKEFAKQGKVPRLYVTYDAGCMYANELPEWAKVCLNGMRKFESNGVTVYVNIFAKPTSVGLRDALNHLIDCMCRKDEVYILIYSDDSCWSGNLNGVPFAFNVDISSCDSGNKGGVFGLIFMLLSQFSPELALGLCSQCANVIKLTNPENPDELCEIYMHSLFEGSGTVLTTILNHVAMYMIAQAALVLFGSKRTLISSWEEVSFLVEKAGMAFGHVLSVEPARDSLGFCPEKIQFLKRSPLRLTTGEYVPVLNYGTIFRGFGSIEGDLTADMVGMSVVEFAQLSKEKRAEVFLSGVVAGLKNEPNSIVLSALRRRFDKLPGSIAGVWENLDSSKFSSQTAKLFNEEEWFPSLGGDVETSSLCRRYNLTTSELAAFAGKISNARIGYLYPDVCVGAFASVDYGCKLD